MTEGALLSLILVVKRLFVWLT